MPTPLPSTQMFCTQPFDWCEIHPDGQVFLCCPAWLKTAIGNLLHAPLDQIWNGERARQVRKAILNGSFSGCNRQRCPRLASATAPVIPLRQVADPDIRKALQNGDTTLAYGPKTLNLCHDRSCNLACASCRRDFHLARGPALKTVTALTEKIRREAGPSAETLILSGTGDPFGSPTYRGLLQHFDARDFPRLKNIRLHSNGQLWNKALWESLTPIHPYVQTAEISIDAATDATYALNRHGGDFRQLLTNLRYIAGLPIALTLSFVVQSNNYREMPAFVALAHNLGAAVYFSQLVNWGTFSRQEFGIRAVHRADHPEHADFLLILRSLADRPRVDLGNLSPLLARKDTTQGDCVD